MKNLTAPTWSWLGEEGTDSLGGRAGARVREERCLGHTVKTTTTTTTTTYPQCCVGPFNFLLRCLFHWPHPRPSSAVRPQGWLQAGGFSLSCGWCSEGENVNNGRRCLCGSELPNRCSVLRACREAHNQSYCHGIIFIIFVIHHPLLCAKEELSAHDVM